MTDKIVTVADIYCGAGGLSAGFTAAKIDTPGGSTARFEIVYGVDNDCDAMKSFRHYHFPGLSEDDLSIVAPCVDIAKVTADSILEAVKLRGYDQLDVIIGGPNCQGVSAAGLRNPEDERNKMLTAFINLVKSLSPKWFVMENVPGLTHVNNHKLLKAIFEEFESIEGYKVSGDILLAADYGVPQLRYRLFVVGTKTDSPLLFPLATYKPPKARSNELVYEEDSYVNVKKAIGDLQSVEPRTYDANAIPVEDEISNHYCTRLSNLNKERIAQIEPGGDWRNMPMKYLPERYFTSRVSDQKGAYGRLLWDWPAYTITNATGNVTAGVFTHPEHDRVLSVREAACLQSFEKEHRFYGHVASQYRQVGNAVPPDLAKAVARSILLSNYDPGTAKSEGRQGRLNLQIVNDTLEGKQKFPTLTPRQIHPLVSNLGKRKAIPRIVSTLEKSQTIRAWGKTPRPPDPYPESTQWLRKLAKQPGNYRAAKRARVIVQFLDNTPEEEIVSKANVTEASVRKWVDGYFNEGLDGWRAYHTSIIRIANHDKELACQLEEAVTKVRMYDPEPSKNGSSNGITHLRLHMNAYLVSLKDQYGHLSVAELVHLVEEKLGYGIGTVYTDDLLAIADVVVGRLSHD